MRQYIVLAILLVSIIFYPNKEKFKITKNCKFPRGCPSRRTKGMWYGLRGYPKTYRKH